MSIKWIKWALSEILANVIQTFVIISALVRLWPFEDLMKTTMQSMSCIWENLKRESKLNILLCWYISLLNETSHIFGSTDSCILYIKLKMPWQPLFLGNWRIICVVHFLYNKWKVEVKIKCYDNLEKKIKKGYISEKL